MRFKHRCMALLLEVVLFPLNLMAQNYSALIKTLAKFAEEGASLYSVTSPANSKSWQVASGTTLRASKPESNADNGEAKVTGKADFHLFIYAQKDEAGQTSLGKELDLTFVYKFLQPVKIVTGASVFLPSEVFNRLEGNKLGVKLYSMMLVNF